MLRFCGVQYESDYAAIQSFSGINGDGHALRLPDGQE
jgi:hypothetical protein